MHQVLDHDDRAGTPRTASATERRASTRASTVLLIGKIHDGRATTACLVLNLSDVGLMARLNFAAEVGQRVAVEMRGMPLAVATIRWVNGAKAGMEFDFRQNLNPVFCLLSDDGVVARPPRFDVSLEAILRIAGRGMKVHVINISPGGVRLAADAAVERGQTGQIVVTGRDVCMYGSVRWVENGEFGFHFSTPLSLRVLRDCLED